MIIWSKKKKKKTSQMRGNKGTSFSHKVILIVMLMIWVSFFLVFFLLSGVASEISKNTVHSSDKLKKPHGHNMRFFLRVMHFRQYPRVSFCPVLMWVQSQNAHANKHRRCRRMLQVWAGMFCIRSLMVTSLEDYPFWEKWFPDVTASAHFHVSEREPAFPGTRTH